MRSSIKIDRNESDQPVIRIKFFPISDDLRDRTIQKFLEDLDTSPVCQIRFVADYGLVGRPEESFKTIDITPVPLSSISELFVSLQESLRPAP